MEHHVALLQRKIPRVHVRLMYDDLGTIQTLPVVTTSPA